VKLVVPGDGRMIVVGDTHGQLEDVLWIFFKYGPPSRKNQYLFNGDIVDRGGHALEILLLILSLKRDDPSCVHVLRGNHEDETTCSMFGYKAELESKFGDSGGWILNTCNTQVFPLLPLAAVVSDVTFTFSMCVVHGGIPVNIPGQQGPLMLEGQLSKLDRRVTTVQKDRSDYTLEDHLLFNVLWADPAKPGDSGMVPTGRGNLFSERDTLDFCRANRVHLLVRAHQPPEGGRGFAYAHGGRCLTVFSASNYCGNLGNSGGVLLCEGQGLVGRGPQAVEHTAPAWRRLADILGAHGLLDTPPAVRARLASQEESGAQPETGRPALQQIEQYVAQHIVGRKQRLFQEFCRTDPRGSGRTALAGWKQVMASLLPDVPPVWDDLAAEWQLAHPVAYVQFLHRFQIVSELTWKRSAMMHIDVFHAMSQLRVMISDVQADALLCGLDRDLSGTVDLAEFQSFLDGWHIEVPRCQSAALYEALMVSLGRNPAVEDVVLAIALISRSPLDSPCGSEWVDAAKEVGEEIRKSGQSLVGFFRQWDTDRNGFLSHAEVERALIQGIPRVGKQFTAEQMKTLVHHMDSQGLSNDRISLVEFLRAVGPGGLARELSGALLGEVLRPVLEYRSVLEAVFQRQDPVSSNVVSLDQFRAGLEEMNRQLSAMGDLALTEYQLQAVGEIAAGGATSVHYREFLRSLRVVDTLKRAQLSQAAVQGLHAALSM